MRKHFQRKCIIHETTCPYTPQHNGIVEIKHRHLLEIARALRFESGVPIKLWGECILTACYLLNLLPTDVLNGISPYEKLTGKPSLVKHLMFGSLSFDKMLNTYDKFGSQSIPFVFMGYSLTQKGYKLLYLETKTMFVMSCSRKIYFPLNLRTMMMVVSCLMVLRVR